MKIVATAVNIPVIAHGGAGKKEDVVNVLKNGMCDGIAISGMFHYAALRENRNLAEVGHTEGNKEFIKSNMQVKAYKEASSIMDLKQYLDGMEIVCRI